MKSTRPTSIRFEETKLEFIKKTENIKSTQKVVDFLVDEYWKLYSPPPESRFSLKSATIEKESGQAVAKFQFQEKQLPSFQEIMNSLSDLELPEEYRLKSVEICSYTHITEKQKELLLKNLTAPKY